MKRDSLDMYDKKPEAMIAYLRHYGPHFNRKMCDFAISKMYKIDKMDSKKEYIEPLTKDFIDNALESSNIKLDNNILYDYIYVANMCKADFWGSSITTRENLAKYIKDVIDDDDAYDGIVFNRWYADMCKKGLPIDWESMI